MEGEKHVAVEVKATFRLGSESHMVHGNGVTISEQLVSMKEQSMNLLKEFITQNNVPNDIPDDLGEYSSEEGDEIVKTSRVKNKKTKLG